MSTSTVTVVRPSAPLDLCVTVAELKANASMVEGTDQDDLIRSLILAAQDYVEQAARTYVNPVTVTEKLSCFPYGAIALSAEPVRSFTSLTYADIDGVEQTLTPQTWLERVPAMVYPPATGWPTTEEDNPAPVTLVYTAGPATSAQVRSSLKMAIMMIATTTFEFPGGWTKGGELKIPHAIHGFITTGSRRGYP